jgi:hypothetical protein
LQLLLVPINRGGIMPDTEAQKPRQPAPEQDEDRGSDLLPELPADEHEEELIDEALAETFPASDPVAIPVPEDQRAK